MREAEKRRSGREGQIVKEGGREAGRQAGRQTEKERGLGREEREGVTDSQPPRTRGRLLKQIEPTTYGRRPSLSDGEGCKRGVLRWCEVYREEQGWVLF